MALLAGCAGDPATTQSTTDAQLDLTPEVHMDLATLRRVTAPFHDFDAARRAGWSAQITACLQDPAGTGAMGYHYGNPNLIDGAVSVDQPELLLYEPQKNGPPRLVAVEYIVPLSEWHSAAPPRLFGRDFHVIAAFQVWALHAWVWQPNPNGIFTDWNPRVTCANAAAVTVMSHH
jgi:hypothetical protein